MKPFYQEAGITIYHADNREVMPFIKAHATGPCFDLLLTDPPYGIGADDRKRILSRGKLAAPQDYGEGGWDNEPPLRETIECARAMAARQIIWGGNYFDVPPSKCWLVWDKQQSGDFADCELAWTNLDMAVRRIVHRWNGMLRKGNEARFHPTQKPLDVMSWCLSLVPDAKTVIDPWMGSGTTLVAAKLRGLKAVGIEREERYCQIAVERLRQQVLPLA